MFAALTVVTQVGGLIYALALMLRALLAPSSSRPRATLWVLFACLYAGLWAPVGWAASLAGRPALPCFDATPATLAASPLTCALHRHYVSPPMRKLAHALSKAVDAKFPDTLTIALDGSFPFLNGFPLIPHLSHDDGRKLDMAFYYASPSGYARGETKSPIGYWAFEEPGAGQAHACPPGGLRWNMSWLRPIHRRDLELDEARTRYALTWLAAEGPRHGLGKAFVEPHLAQRLDVRGRVIRFQGCRAARHDDHLHVQLR